ncbi:hypothetical protein C9I56_11195 [Paraburkholderia caribensis]|nr:hypothetical protein C9I56_11195 [Paraburkholderia caribensis]
MLYRKGTQDRLHGVHVDTIVVDENEVDTYLDDGWYRTPAEAGKEEHAAGSRSMFDDIAERLHAIDAEEARLIAMREDLDRRHADLAAAEAAAASKKAEKPQKQQAAAAQS